MKSVLIGLGTIVIGFFFINIVMMSVFGGRGDSELAIVISILFLSGVVAISAAEIIKKLEKADEVDWE